MNFKIINLDKHFVFILCCFITGCSSQKTNRVPLFLENEKRAIIVPVKFRNITAPYMLFDSGMTFGVAMLDSTFCANNPSPAWSVPDAVISGNPSAWESSSNQNKVQYTIFNRPININLCNEDFDFQHFFTRDLSKWFVGFLNGVSGFTKDSTRIWEFNFEHNYLDIHKADNFKMPSNCYKLPLLNGSSHCPFVQFPISVKYSDGDTVTINELYLLDTADVYDLILLGKAHKNVLDFFKKRDNAIQIENRGNYRSRYIVEATIFNGLKIDSMRIYTDEFTNLTGEAGVIGLNFMKRFNLFFDFKTNQLGLQPIKNFERIVNQDVRRFYFSWDISADKRRFVKNIADIKNNYFKDAGLQEGDEVVTINEIELQSLTNEENKTIGKSRIREMNIIRNGKPIKIVVHLGEEAFYE